MNFSDNPDYQKVFTSKYEGKDINFYVPSNTVEGYHISRYVAAQAQAIYSNAGITAPYLATMMDKILEMANDSKSRTFRTDIGVIANQIKYRTQYPVDQDCAIRMGCIYLFIDGENPDVCDNTWIEHKMKIARQNPEVYAFFLNVGILRTPHYQELLEASKDVDYLKTREMALQNLTLIP